MSKTPSLIWAQRHDKVFVTFTEQDLTTAEVQFADGLLSIKATSKGGEYKLENMPLWLEIIPDESKWFKNDRALVVSLKKKDSEYWDGLTTDKGLKKFIKVDFSKFCEEDDPEYTGQIAMTGMDEGGMGGMGGMPGMGGMGGMPGMGGMGGMGGMDMEAMMQQMGGMGGMGGMGDFEDDGEEDANLDDLNPDDAPPPLEATPAVKPEDMEEVD